MTELLIILAEILGTFCVLASLFIAGWMYGTYKMKTLILAEVKSNMPKFEFPQVQPHNLRINVIDSIQLRCTLLKDKDWFELTEQNTGSAVRLEYRDTEPIPQLDIQFTIKEISGGCR